MDLEKEKKSLKEALDTVDDVYVIRAIRDYLKNAKESGETIGYNAEDTPLSQEQFKAEIDKAREAYEAGQYISNEAMKAKSQNW